MQLDEYSRRVIDQFLQARLLGAQAALEATATLHDSVLPAKTTQNFLFIADILRRWHALDHPISPPREHRGRLLTQYFTSNQFELRRSKRLPLLSGDEDLQTQLIMELWKEFLFTMKPIPVRINQRGDKLTIRFDYKKLPANYLQVFSRRRPTDWLMSHLTLQNLTAWLWYQEFLNAGIKASASSSQPHSFSLSFQVVTQLSLPF